MQYYDDEPKDVSLNKVEDETTSDFDVDWVNPPDISDLQADYDAALPEHEAQMTKIEAWHEILYPKKKKYGNNRSSVQPKLARKQAEWRYSALSEPFLSTDDLFNTLPRTFKDKEAARQNGLLLNHQFNTKISKVKFIDEYIRVAVDQGSVILKAGWNYEYDIVDVEVPIMQQVPVTDPAMANNMMMQGVPPVQTVQVGTEIEQQEVVVANHPTVEVCENSNVIIDPSAKGDMDKAKFVIHEFEVSIADLEEDERYQNLDSILLEEVNPLLQAGSDIDNPSNFQFKDDARKLVLVKEYWGYWDIHETGVVKPILVSWVGKTIVRMEDNPFPDGKLPFELVHYLPKVKENYGEPDCELIKDNQDIIGAVSRGMIDLMGRSANAQQGTATNFLDVANKRKFESGEDYQYNPAVNPNTGVYMHKYPEIPASAFQMIEIQSNEAESLTGVKAFTGGISGQALGATATGIRSALDATSKRELGILRRLSEGLVSVGRKFIAMNKDFLEDSEIIAVTDEDNIVINRDDLSGDLDIKLSISTAEADNERAQELSFMLQTIGNSVPFDLTKLLLVENARLRKMPELAKRLEEFSPEPDPLAQKEAELRIQLLEAQVYNERNKGKENDADAKLKLAKARALESDADLKDLDMVERMDGTDVEKERQRQNNSAITKLKEELGKAAIKTQ